MSNISWIKIKTDIFDDEKIKVIDSLPERDAIFVIWIKLLTLAGKINDKGQIYLTETIPYTDEMLSTIFSRPISTIKMALMTFDKFNMIDINNEFIGIVNWDKHQNVGGMEKVRDQSKLRSKKYRDAQKQKAIEFSDVTVTSRHGTEKNREEKNKNREDNKYKMFSTSFIEDDEWFLLWSDWLSYKSLIKDQYKTQNGVETKFKELVTFSGDNIEIAKSIIKQSMDNEWKGIFKLDEFKQKTNNGSKQPEQKTINSTWEE